MSKTTYRPEIDGLRAIAVLSVLVYHLNLSIFDAKLLQGGFLGVDVFFVISGFLIFGLIRLEFDHTGRFSVLGFYERRARRLLPALFVVIAATFAVSGYFLVPSGIEQLATSAMASIVFASNIYWLAESQTYGAASGLLQPLLHTWSLAVEEQFYIVFPLLYVVFLRFLPKAIGVLAGAAIFGGLLGAIWFTENYPNFSFYMIFTRIWELLAGALLGHALVKKPDLGHDFRLAWLMPKLGLLAIIVSLFTVHLSWNHPGLGTIGVVAGTVAIIWFARAGEPVTRLLSSRPMTAIGLISYSLYLWHYPIFAYGRLHALLEPGWRDYSAWIALTFLFAFLSYRFIERPFRMRDRVGNRTLIGSGVASVFVLAAAAGIMLGSPARMPGQAQLAALYGDIEPDNELLRTQSWVPLNGLDALGTAGERNVGYPSAREQNELWFDLEREGTKILVVGNSHSKDMFNVLAAAAEQTPALQVARYGFDPFRGERKISRLTESPNFQSADVVVFSSSYSASDLADMAGLIASFQASGKAVAIMSQSLSFEGNNTFNIVDVYLRKKGSRDPGVLNKRAWEMISNDHETLNAALEALAGAHAVPFLRKSDFICDETERACMIMTPDGQKAIYDSAHYTVEGARAYGARIVEIGWLNDIIAAEAPE